MKIEILQEQLLQGVSNALRAISPRVQLPVLSHILVEAQAQGIVLSATDLEIGVRIKVPAKVEEEGRVTVPAKMLYEFLSSLSPGKVSIKTEGESIKVKSGGYSASLQTMAVEEFPQLPQFSNLVGEIEASAFASSVEKVVFAAAKESLRPVLTGVLFEFAKGVKLVATDGFRLAIQKIEAKATTEQSPLLVPARVVSEISRLIKDETIKIGYLAESHQLLFAGADTLLVSQLIDGNFPDYQKILPKEFETQVEMSREELLQAVKASYIFARDNSNMMKWEVAESKVLITANSPERGECRVEVPAKIDGQGGSIVFNAKFVMDYLAIGESAEIQFGMSSNLAPGMFFEKGKDGGKYVVMPINV